MKLRNLLAVSLGLSMMLAVPAYANDADAVAVYQQMEEKSKTMTDMDAYYDYTIAMSDGSTSENMRMEMNAKANHLQDPDHLRMNMYTRLIMDNGSNGPGGLQTPDAPITEMAYNMYYENGMYYMDMMGQKMKQPMPIADMMKQVKSTTDVVNTDLKYLKDMKLRMEGEDRIISFAMDMTEMNGMLDQVMEMMRLPQTSGTDDFHFGYREVTGEYVVNPDGYCTRTRLKMVMDITAEGETLIITMDGDVGFANPGQPVEIPTPNLAEYLTVEQMEQQAFAQLQQ